MEICEGKERVLGVKFLLCLSTRPWHLPWHPISSRHSNSACQMNELINDNWKQVKQAKALIGVVICFFRHPFVTSFLILCTHEPSCCYLMGVLNVPWTFKPGYCCLVTYSATTGQGPAISQSLSYTWNKTGRPFSSGKGSPLGLVGERDNNREDKEGNGRWWWGLQRR